MEVKFLSPRKVVERCIINMFIKKEETKIGPKNKLQVGAPNSDTLYFRDSRRRIDMILVYEVEEMDQGIMRQEKRNLFEASLRKEGLELEVEGKEETFDHKTCFVKVHIPWGTLRKYAEMMALKLPIKETEVPKKSLIDDTCWPFNFRHFFDYNRQLIPREPSYYMATYCKDREQRFIVNDRELVFSPAERSLVVWRVLRRVKYDQDEMAGIRQLLDNGTYLAAFPLHDGDYRRDNPTGTNMQRRLLYLEWARPTKWFKRQPIFLIKRYFGEKIGLYFVWLGLYTTMLIPATIVGITCTIYGLASINSKHNLPSAEICDPHGPGNITVCPLCDRICRYKQLSDSCSYSQLNYLVDNPATVFFAIFMSFWATTFLEIWKRRHAVIAWEWDLGEVDENEEPRPEFEETATRVRANPVTRQEEHYVSTWVTVVRCAATGSVVLFMIAVVVAVILGIVVYKMSVAAALYSTPHGFVRSNAHLATLFTASLLNLVVILLLTKVYGMLAVWLVKFENPRTKTEFEFSYTLKIFAFQFINFYGSIIYIAFFKGRFFVHPGDMGARKSPIHQLRVDSCDPAGCLSELSIQLAIIMVGKQTLNNVIEIFQPVMKNWFRRREQRANTVELDRKYTRWEEDYYLENGGRFELFGEYLEMVLQYGFVTLFIAAFPLAPLFALINNVIEIRLDAYKMVAQMRRPVAERVRDIGAWYGILQAITYASVVSNAFVIAFTSEFIPRLVYTHVYSPTSDLVGFIGSTLSEFNTSDYPVEVIRLHGRDVRPTCHYRGYRNGPDDPDKYGLSPQYWHVLIARLLFVVVFEHVVFALTGVMAYAIPDVPATVHTQMRREKQLAREAMVDHVVGHGGRANSVFPPYSPEDSMA